MGIKFIFSTFTPAEAETISGISGMQQRNLRRHGYLPEEGKGWTRYSIEELARLMVIAALSEVGVTPAVGSYVADEQVGRTTKSAATIIWALACNNPDAILRNVVTQLDERPVKLSPSGLPRFLIVLPGKKIKFESVVPTFESGTDGHVATVIDLQGLANAIVQRARKPLVTVVKDHP